MRTTAQSFRTEAQSQVGGARPRDKLGDSKLFATTDGNARNAINDTQLLGEKIISTDYTTHQILQGTGVGPTSINLAKVKKINAVYVPPKSRAQAKKIKPGTVSSYFILLFQIQNYMMATQQSMKKSISQMKLQANGPRDRNTLSRFNGSKSTQFLNNSVNMSSNKNSRIMATEK